MHSHQTAELRIGILYLSIYMLFRAGAISIGVLFPVEATIASLYIAYRCVVSRISVPATLALLSLLITQTVLAAFPDWDLMYFLVRVAQLLIPGAIVLFVIRNRVVFHRSCYIGVLFFALLELWFYRVFDRTLFSGNENSSAIIFTLFFLVALIGARHSIVSGVALLSIPALFVARIQTAVTWMFMLLYSMSKASVLVVTLFLILGSWYFSLFEGIWQKVRSILQLMTQVAGAIPVASAVGSVENRLNAIYFLFKGTLNSPWGAGLGQAELIVEMNRSYLSVGSLHNAPLVFVYECGVPVVAVLIVFLMFRLNFRSLLFLCLSMLLLVSLSDNAFSHSGFWACLAIGINELNDRKRLDSSAAAPRSTS